MVRESIRAALVDAVRGMGVDGDMPDLELGRTKSPELGDYATSAPQKLARVLRQPPPHRDGLSVGHGCAWSLRPSDLNRTCYDILS